MNVEFKMRLFFSHKNLSILHPVTNLLDGLPKIFQRIKSKDLVRSFIFLPYLQVSIRLNILLQLKKTLRLLNSGL